jgi:hypothetical protein
LYILNGNDCASLANLNSGPITVTGAVSATGTVTGASLQAGSAGSVSWNTRSILTSPADGKVKATNAAAGEAMIYAGAKTITTASGDPDGDAAAATSIVPDNANTILLVCSDNDGCTGTFGSEAAAVAGMQVLLVGSTGYTTTIADQDGVIETIGEAAMALDPNSSVELFYDGAAWRQRTPVATVVP